MAAAPGFLTLHQFEQLYQGKKPHFEYWFGEAIQKSMPTSLHSLLQMAIVMLLRQSGWKAGPEMRLKISKGARPFPDVVASHKPLENPYPTEPVDLCVEILSPGDKLRRMLNKAAHYLDWGIGTVWIIDPQTRGAYVMSLQNPQPVEVGMSDQLTAGAGGRAISISFGEVFAEAEKDLVHSVETR